MTLYQDKLIHPHHRLLEDHEELVVEAIVDSRIHYHTLQYRVKWRGYDDLTWETMKATIKTSSSKPDGPPDSPRRTPTPPPPPPPPPPPSPKPPGAGREDENPKGSKKGEEKETEVEKSKKGSKDGSKCHGLHLGGLEARVITLVM